MRTTIGLGRDARLAITSLSTSEPTRVTALQSAPRRYLGQPADRGRVGRPLGADRRGRPGAARTGGLIQGPRLQASPPSLSLQALVGGPWRSLTTFTPRYPGSHPS
jgi:hypothetical protein